MTHPIKTATALVPLLLLALAAPAAAQNRDAVERAKADLEAQHVNLQGACGAARIANLVAWRARPAYGLLRKAGGFRAVLTANGCVDGDASSDPEGRATDYLIQRATGVGFDVLGDAGGANRPGWDGPESDDGIIARNFAQFREPIDPRGYYREDGVTTPVPQPAPPPLPSIDLAPLLVHLATLDARLGGIESRMATLEAQQKAGTEAVRGDIKAFRDAVGIEWRKVAMFVTKYGSLLAGALAAGRAMP